MIVIAFFVGVAILIPVYYLFVLAPFFIVPWFVYDGLSLLVLLSIFFTGWLISYIIKDLKSIRIGGYVIDVIYTLILTYIGFENYWHLPSPGMIVANFVIIALGLELARMRILSVGKK